jgi:hypothetical protein
VAYRLLADALVVVHAAFVLFVVLGGLAGLRWPQALFLHLPALLWGAYAELTATVCPLTPLENHWRTLAGQQGYAGSFVEHYLLPILYPPGLSPASQHWLGVLLVIGNLLVYAACFHQVGRRHRRGALPPRE